MLYAEIVDRLDKLDRRGVFISVLDKAVIKEAKVRAEERNEPVSPELLERTRNEFATDITEWYDSRDPLDPYDALLTGRDIYVLTWAIAKILRDREEPKAKTSSSNLKASPKFVEENPPISPTEIGLFYQQVMASCMTNVAMADRMCKLVDTVLANTGYPPPPVVTEDPSPTDGMTEKQKVKELVDLVCWMANSCHLGHHGDSNPTDAWHTCDKGFCTSARRGLMQVGYRRQEWADE